jgi:hypothetical protein
LRSEILTLIVALSHPDCRAIIGFTTVDALLAKPYSPRVFFLLDAPPEIRQRSDQIALHWKGLITWHPE